MANPDNDAFALLVKPLRRALEERGFHTPSEPQQKAIPLILEGKNVLLISPTATGKTEAAILPILNNHLLTPERPPGVKALYITPLRALNRDLMERLEWWCKRLDVKVGVRHGDTDIGERTAQARSPPDVLITTPETLQAILTGRLMRTHLGSVRWVVVDEIHELASDKRGSQLSLALERLRWIAMHDFQTVGLSATVGTPERVAQFLVGTDRPYEIVRVPVARDMRLQILYSRPHRDDYELASKLYTHPEVVTRLKAIRGLMEEHNSVLLFTNTRSVAEVLASRFKVWDIDFPVSIHHGSLAKPSRIMAERGLKEGRLKGLVCTSSLELGIDVGRIDLVIQYNSPRQVSRIVQRVGRSGHRIGLIPKGVVITLDSDDTLEAMAISRRAMREELEPLYVPEKPYDALTHQLAGLLMLKKRWHFVEILELCRQAYPYRDLSMEDLEGVLSYMHTRYPRLVWASFEEKTLVRPQKSKEMYQFYFENLSMIPDQRQYLVVEEENDAPVGVLDEAFVAEYGEPGVKFIVRGSAWKIKTVYGDKIYVKPVEDPAGAIPSWVGEEIPVPFEVAEEVGAIRRSVEEGLAGGRKPREIAQQISERYPVSVEVASLAIKEAVEQIRQHQPLPTDKRLVLGEWEDYVILECCLGSLVNKTLARVVGHLLSERTGQVVGVQEDPYRIVFQVPSPTSVKDVAEVLSELPKMDLGKVAVEAVVKTGLFKRRLVNVARKFGAVSKRADFSALSLKMLMKSFEGTAIYQEAVKDTLKNDMDVENTEKVLRRLGEGEMALEILPGGGGKPTPISRIGLERISRKTDIIPPERMRSILTESARARLLDEAAVFLCTECWGYVEMRRMKDLPPTLSCPHCKSAFVGMVKGSEEEAVKLSERVKRGVKGAREERLSQYAVATAQLLSKYGSPAALALAGRGVRPEDAEDVLTQEATPTDRFFELITEAERRALKRRFL